jgi:GNAT superfamily N-acetyltransferase
MEEIAYQGYRLRLMRSRSSPTELFALIGQYLASPRVRHECGGYALNDGPHYWWLIAQKQGEPTAAGLLSFEITHECLRLHHGYLDPAHRGHGIFRAMLRLLLGIADSKGFAIDTRVTTASVPYFQKLGFESIGSHGQWQTLTREARTHGRSN